MERTEIKIETFKYDENYLIDVVTLKDTYEAWVYHKNYGVKSLMFGCPIEQQTYQFFLEMVEANADEYIEFYAEEYEN